MTTELEQKEELADNVFDYIKQEKTAYETRGVPLTPNWEWSMRDHINRSFSLKNSKFTTGNNDNKRPFKNIIIPIANVNYRTEGFDVKDVELYVDDSDYFHLSLLARKYHEKWARENNIDTAIDESVESHFDYGLILVKNVNETRPEVVPLQRIAFCDQTDILSGPICEVHHLSIDQLLDMKGKWYDDEIDMAVAQAEAKKNVSLANKDAKTPGKYIEAFELHGTFPLTWLNKGEEEEYTKEDGYHPQIYIATYYKGEDGRDKGICLFKGKEYKPVYKAYKRTSRFGTACGMGGIEELFDPQTWANYSEIHLQKMLETTSKIVIKASKAAVDRNNTTELKNGQIIKVETGEIFEQVVIQPFNKAAFDNYVNAWEQQARTLGSASDPALGLNSKSGTPLGETQIVTSQGEGIHEYRQGKIASFWGEIYRDWVITRLQKDMSRGDKWVDELSLDELQEVAERVAVNATNKRVAEMVLANQSVTPEDQETMRNFIKSEFMKGGKKRFLEIAEAEFKKLPLKLKFNIAGKQKYMAEMVNKLNGVFRTVFANPAVLQAPGMGELFNNILESSGLSPINFASFTQQSSPMQGAIPSPMQPEPVLTPNA
jgi:hypothetical protein